MEVAVGVGGDHAVALGQGKDHLGFAAGGQMLDLDALPGLQGDPLDEVLCYLLL